MADEKKKDSIGPLFTVFIILFGLQTYPKVGLFMMAFLIGILFLMRIAVARFFWKRY